MRQAALPLLLGVVALQAVSAATAFAEGAISQDDLAMRPSGALGMTAFGTSGGLTIPDGRVLPDGEAALGFNSYIDPRFSRATRGENYLFGMGLLPSVEVSARLANYPVDRRPSDRFDFVVRDLSANVKVALPHLFRYQPDLAVGINDLSGGASFFRSKYLVASQSFGPVRATLGAARGQQYLDGLFGGVEMGLWNTGVSVLAERSGGANHVGLRYASQPFASVGNMRVLATVQRSLGTNAPNGNRFDRTAFGIQLLIPFGDQGRSAPPMPARTEAIFTPLTAPSTGQLPPLRHPAAPLVVESALPASTPTPVAPASTQDAIERSLRQVRAALENAGLERVRVGVAGDTLVIEYENHRYNRNEVDAIGIVLGIGTRLAPETVHSVSVITKKSGLALYETTVDKAQFARFLADGNLAPVRQTLSVQLHPHGDANVRWLDQDESAHGYSRIRVGPVLQQFVGTEVGLYDYSLGVAVQPFVPLWKGAEASVRYVSDLADSKNVRDGGAFEYGQIRSGVKSAILSQALWLGDHALNVTSAGKFLYDYTGVQNETVLFVPGRGDQVRLQYTRLHYSDRYFQTTQVSAGAFYRWTYQPLNLWVEAGYNQYVRNDRGPTLRVSRWFGDVQAQAYVRRSDLGTFAGFQLVFPLTPRQGMRPGVTSIEGPSGFAYGLETKLATNGSVNYITRGIAEEIPIEYSAQDMLLNRGRVGEDYVRTQLPRMRESALLYDGIESTNMREEK